RQILRGPERTLDSRSSLALIKAVSRGGRVAVSPAAGLRPAFAPCRSSRRPAAHGKGSRITRERNFPAIRNEARPGFLWLLVIRDGCGDEAPWIDGTATTR